VVDTSDNTHTLRRRKTVFSRLREANIWLASRASARDVRMFDMEAARAKLYNQLVDSQRPDLPAVLDNYGRRRMVVSIADVDEMIGPLIEDVEALLEDPDAFGVILLADYEESNLLLSQEER
jgi:hypothetical protein